MNVEIGTETPIFLFCEYLFRNFGIFFCLCSAWTNIILKFQKEILFGTRKAANLGVRKHLMTVRNVF